MGRSADYTIQGFLYQFHLTLLHILNSEDNEEVTIEGIIEDIEIKKDGNIEAIQCKYHESKDNFTLSSVYKPILQMMEHFHINHDKSIRYRLYSFFQNQELGIYNKITRTDIEQVLKSKDKSLQKIIKRIKGCNIDEFLNQFTMEFGESYDNLIIKIIDAFIDIGFKREDVETLIYPNAIQIIAELSINHDIDKRVINKTTLLNKLKSIRITTISKWTRNLKNFDQLIKTRKNQMKVNLNKNSRTRYFYISENEIIDFHEGIVNFIIDYIEKYHFKKTHDKTPLFCLNCSKKTFDDIGVRLYKKGIKFNNGFITGNYFDKERLFLEPVKAEIGKLFQVEFQIRLLHLDSSNILILNEHKCDDFFILNSIKPEGLEEQDINIEHIELDTFKQIKYVMGMNSTYE